MITKQNGEKNHDRQPIKSKNKQEFITADITMKFILVDKKNDFILDFYLSPADYK